MKPADMDTRERPIVAKPDDDADRVLAKIGPSLFQAGFSAAALLDDRAVLCEVNPAFCRVFRSDRADLIGRPLVSFLQPSARSLGAAALAGLQSAHGFEGEFPVIAGDGTLTEVEWRFQPQVAPGRHLA